jgi:hypothetical protein
VLATSTDSISPSSLRCAIWSSRKWKRKALLLRRHEHDNRRRAGERNRLEVGAYTFAGSQSLVAADGRADGALLFKGEVHEASSTALARGMLKARAYCGMILALDPGPKMQPAYDFSLIDEVRARQTACPDDMPVAVMVERCDADLAQALRRRDVSRIILKPFRARVILELVSEFSGLARRASSA